MPRRRKKFTAPAASFELFPFLSVVACTLGSLVLIIIIITTKVSTSEQQILLTLPESEQEADLTDNTAVYVECRDEEIVLYPGGQSIPEGEISASNSQLQQFLTEAKQKENTIVYLLVRPNGVSVFDQVRTIIEQEDIQFRYEPLEEDWQLNV